MRSKVARFVVPMLRSSLLKSLTLLVAATAGMVGFAEAQTPRCDAWRAELSQLGRGSAQPGSPRQLQQVADQLGRAQQSYNALECGGSWVLSQRPPQCGQLAAQINSLRSQYAALQGGAGGSEGRRQQLIAAINNNCQPGQFFSPGTQPVAVPQPPPQPRTLFEALFGVQTAPQQRMPDTALQPGLSELDGLEERRPRFGAGAPVCVRTCDGFFFPLANSPTGREGQQEMCAALCPAAETEVFYMSGDGNIETAVGRRGQPYMSLPNASRYTRQFDASCTCRRPGQNWAAALSDAEAMIERRRGDILVNETRAAEMSRANPQQARAIEQARQRQEAALRAELANDAAVQQAVDAQGRAAPTASTETAGINTSAGTGGVVSANQGERREVTTATGERRTIRIVAPNLAPATN